MKPTVSCRSAANWLSVSAAVSLPATRTVPDNLSLTGPVAKVGANTLVLSGTNAVTGGFRTFTGTLQFNSPAATGGAPIALADTLLAATRRFASPSGALIRLPGPTSASGAWSDGLEGYARTFLLAAFRANAADRAGAEVAALDRSVERLANAHKGEIAAVVVEPVAGNMGCVPPEPGYLEAVREITQRHGIVLPGVAREVDRVLVGLCEAGDQRFRAGLDRT